MIWNHKIRCSPDRIEGPLCNSLLLLWVEIIRIFVLWVLFAFLESTVIHREGNWWSPDESHTVECCSQLSSLTRSQTWGIVSRSPNKSSEVHSHKIHWPFTQTVHKCIRKHCNRKLCRPKNPTRNLKDPMKLCTELAASGSLRFPRTLATPHGAQYYQIQSSRSSADPLDLVALRITRVYRKNGPKRNLKPISRYSNWLFLSLNLKHQSETSGSKKTEISKLTYTHRRAPLLMFSALVDGETSPARCPSGDMSKMKQIGAAQDQGAQSTWHHGLTVQCSSKKIRNF